MWWCVPLRPPIEARSLSAAMFLETCRPYGNAVRNASITSPSLASQKAGEAPKRQAESIQTASGSEAVIAEKEARAMDWT